MHMRHGHGSINRAAKLGFRAPWRSHGNKFLHNVDLVVYSLDLLLVGIAGLHMQGAIDAVTDAVGNHTS